MRRTPHGYTIVVLAGAALGLFFAGFSTYDFAQHLDRQLHGIHCSFMPGLGTTEVGASGCHTTMMSAYSSIFRQSVWGGVPISLAAMSVFAFLLLFAIDLCLTRRQEDRRAAGFLALATALPALASLVMASISFGVLGAACKLCMGIYFSSAVCVLGGILVWRRALAVARTGELDAMAADLEQMQAQRRAAGATAPESGGAGHAGADPAWATGGPTAGAVEPPGSLGHDPRQTDPMAATMMATPSSPELAERPPRPAGTMAAGGGHGARPPVAWGYLGGAFAVGVALVLVPVVAYATMAPDHSTFIGTCGSLVKPADPSVTVPLDHDSGVPTVELFDPLCDHCRAFEQRLGASGLEDQVHRVAALFPLDKDCNWMLTDQIHPGACAVSEAVLCAGDRAREVVDWAFENQERLLAAGAHNADEVRSQIRQRFPELGQCVGTPRIKAKLGKSMRWAVANKLRVLTPQVFIGGVKMCDEDTDLGLDYTLSRMIDRQRAGTLAKGDGR